MKKGIAAFLAFLILQQALGWGFLGHKTINNRAVFALPPELFGFYKLHIDYVTAHSTDPDNRRYLFEDEGCRHYLDCDHYESESPLDTIPHNWYKAVETYTEDSLTAHGIVPWHTILMLRRLTKAFEEKNLDKILKYSADIGHYIADAHVPLHASSNYNGQHTGQHGIHALWESRLPQLFLDSFDILPGTVSYIDNPQEYIWNTMSMSYACVDSVLLIEKAVTARHENDKYAYEIVGNTTVQVYSKAFCEDYDVSMQDMVSRRMKASIAAVASFWYTAWVDAGMPNITEINGTPTPDPLDEKAAKARENGPIKGREEHGKD